MLGTAAPCVTIVESHYLMDQQTRAVGRAIRAAPSSVRELARAAGVSHVLLLRLERGTCRATPTVAGKIAQALEGWGTACLEAASDVREARASRRLVVEVPIGPGQGA